MELWYNKIMISPSTDIRLLKCPLELSDINQLTFANANAQYNYFNGLPKREYDDATYQRKDGVIRFNAEMDDIIQFNYVMYRNENYGNKWFYAYITDMQYINDTMTAVAIKTDVYQTWQFELEFKPCFVEREHVNNDAIGANTVPEGLGTGEYVSNGAYHEFNYQSSSFSVVFLVTELVGGIPAWTSNKGRYYNGIWSGLWTFAVSYANAEHVIKGYTNVGKANAIQSVYLCPTIMTATWNSDNATLDDTTFPVRTPLVNKGSYLIDSVTLTRPDVLDGYAPRNAKMFTSPFCFLYADNNAGQYTEYCWEDFANPNSVKLTEEGAIGQGCSIKLIPENYKNFAGKDGYTYGLTTAKLPVCSWTTDYYTAYMVQNGLNIGLDMARAIGGTAIGVATANPSTVISGFEQVNNTLTDIYKASIAPDVAHGNMSNSDINVAMQKGITVYCKSVRYDVARTIDDYFTKFGYAVKRVKVPNVTGRLNWNFVKTIESYVGGDIPQTDIAEFKALLDKGITFWHNPNTFMDYSQSNAII